GPCKLVTGNAVIGATAATRSNHAPVARRHATSTCHRARLSWRISSIIWRSVPPGSRLDITIARGSGAVSGTPQSEQGECHGIAEKVGTGSVSAGGRRRRVELKVLRVETHCRGGPRRTGRATVRTRQAATGAGCDRAGPKDARRPAV